MEENKVLTAEEEERELAEQARIRREKLQKLTGEGNSPFVKVKYKVTAASEKIKANFEKFEGKKVCLAGRLMSRRIMGKASFCHIQDGCGLIQLYVKRDDVGEDDYASFKKDYDLGDIVGVKGYVFKTQTGEISIHCSHVEMLTKCLLPLPEKQHGLKDTDIRYRRRELDLIVNPEVKNTFKKRSQIISAVREYLDGAGFLEVDTPVLNTIEIGASARPFKTRHNALDIDMYLRIETELYLKRLIVGGFDRVYEVGRIFRNEGMDAFHNPEFTTVECYASYLDYFDMMNLVEKMYAKVAKKVCGTTDVTYQGTEIHLGGKWERLTMKDAVKKYSGADYADWATDEDARECAAKLGVEVEEGERATKGHVLIALFDAFVEDKLVQPTFIYDYPVENSPLAKRKEDEPLFTQRFEYFICGHEFGNAFSELNDPIDQRQRFVKQVDEKRRQEPKCNAQVDEDFVTALEYGLPPTGGLGFGIDRLVMLLTDSATIRDVLLFPTMKPKK